jgi:hypothetical protein
VNDPLAIFIDANLGDHWPDVILAALIALVGYFGSARFTDMERRHGSAEKKFDEVDDSLNDHEKRLTKMETVAEERRRVQDHERHD